MEHETYQVRLHTHNQVGNVVALPPVSRRVAGQRARRERERYQFHSPSVRMSTAQRARRTRERSATWSSCLRSGVIGSQVFSTPTLSSASQLPTTPTLSSTSQFQTANTSDSQSSTSHITHTSITEIVPLNLRFTNTSTFELGSSSSQPTTGVTSQAESLSPRITDHVASLSAPYNIDYSNGDMEAATESVYDEYEYANMEQTSLSFDPVYNHFGERHFLGRMNVECKFCSALHWMDERLSGSTATTSRFGMCCLQGKLRLPLLTPLPAAFISLYEGFDPLATSFRKNIRSYNACNAFTSLGVTMDDRILTGRGPTSFTIHGELCHRVGSLLPEVGTQPSYAQLYIYDASAAVHFRQHRNPHLRVDVLSIINSTLLQTNDLCRLYKHAYEVLLQNVVEDNEIPVSLHYTPGTDIRRYNLPTTDEIAVILPGTGSNEHTTRDIILHLRSGPLHRISECHPAYWPCHYVLLFPDGQLGWHPDMKHWDVKNARYVGRRLTQLEYYAYRLFERPTEYSSILRGGSLFQEFIVDAWAAYEQNRLKYVRKNQEQIRSDVYKGLIDSMGVGMSAPQIGKRFILPSSHPGSPRNMYEIYQDSMAITRFHHHPDIFLTATANPNWPEITNELKLHQRVLDRPDLVARVFELKRKAIMKKIVEHGVLGRVAAYVYTIEFQKRGLPHMHALFYLKGEDKIRTAAQVDRIISAEIPDPDTNPALFSTIIRCMIHGPCGARNPDASCMRDDHGRPRCKAKFPRLFVDATIMDKDGYPTYRRRDTGRVYMVRGHEVDNRDVVPYNPYLSAMFDCHINVEVCSSVQAVKYIHKYIYKGYDMTTLVVGGLDDEIQQYLDSRYIGPIEAAWHLLENPMHKESPHVERLPVHLKGMHHVSFDARHNPEQVLEETANQKSKLSAFFDYYEANPSAPKFTYPDFPQHFVWKKEKDNNRWEPRQRGFAIGRMYFVKPTEGEKFYLRLLLTVVKGPPSFESLKQFGSTVYSTYKDACIARGLLEDDVEWAICLEEASVMRTGNQMRSLFALLLLESSPLHPDHLWNRFALQICDDLSYKLRTSYGIENASNEQITDYGLYLLDKVLLQSGKTLSDFESMPLPKENWSIDVGNRLISEQQQLRYVFSQEETTAQVDRLNFEQRCMYNVVTDSVYNNRGKFFFLNGPAGTGKTFLYNTIAASCRQNGHIAVMVASSGIASLLLSGGRTAHSTFKLPIDVLENSVCGFSKQSMHADLFRATDLIIWDEIPMQHQHCLEAVDRSLRDIRDNTKPFGGITVVVGGDFRQTLPVITRGVREEIVDALVSRSHLWKNVKIVNLVKNMRLQRDNPHNISFADFLTKVGTTPDESLEMPSTINRCSELNELLGSVYPDLRVRGTATPSYLNDRTILAPRNDEVRDINDAALEVFPGECIEYLGADQAIERDDDLPHIVPSYTTETLNGLNPSSLPPFRLKLKIGSPIMLLRNIAPRDGLCNGTRLIVERCATRVVEARILTGDKAGNTVFIPRITLSPSSSELAIPMSRRQFPVRLAFAMTINKSQGQSVRYVGIDLRTPVFSHGQLYVALSRCTCSSNISIILPSDAANCTTNVVYPEVLL